METNQKSRWAVGGAVASAIGASLCCTLPLVVSILGVGLFTGASAFFESIRPYLLGGAGVLLATGYYYAFRKRAQEIDCECDPVTGNPTIQKRESLALRVVLIGATILVIFFAAIPNILTVRGSNARVESVPAENVVVMHVAGMTCAGCVSAVDKALRSVPGVQGVQVSLASKEARAGLDGSAAVTEAMLAAAVDRAGYRAFDFRWERAR